MFQAIVIASALFFQTSLLHAAPLHGVDLAKKINVNGKALLLNGMGVRKATFLQVKVYVAGLYLETLSKDPKNILNSSQLKKVEMHFLHRVPSEKLVTAWNESFSKNCEKDCDALKPVLSELNSMMVDVEPGDALSLTFLQDGVEVKVKNQPSKLIRSKEYSKLLLTTWLGSNPPNEDLKTGLLGL